MAIEAKILLPNARVSSFYCTICYELDPFKPWPFMLSNLVKYYPMPRKIAESYDCGRITATNIGIFASFATANNSSARCAPCLSCALGTARIINKRMLELENKKLCHEWEQKIGLQRPQKFHVVQPDPRSFSLLHLRTQKAALITGWLFLCCERLTVLWLKLFFFIFASDVCKGGHWFSRPGVNIEHRRSGRIQTSNEVRMRAEKPWNKVRMRAKPWNKARMRAEKTWCSAREVRWRAKE